MSDSESDSDVSSVSSVSSVSDVSDVSSDEEEEEKEEEKQQATYTDIQQGAAGGSISNIDVISQYTNDQEGLAIRVKLDKHVLFKINFTSLFKSLHQDMDIEFTSQNETNIQEFSKSLYENLIIYLSESKRINPEQATNLVCNLNGACFSAAYLFLNVVPKKLEQELCNIYIDDYCNDKNIKILLNNITYKDLKTYNFLYQSMKANIGSKLIDTALLSIKSTLIKLLIGKIKNSKK